MYCSPSRRAQVRSALREHGLVVPAGTRFVAALHDTTTDAITIFDADKVPLSHETDLLQLQLWLEEAGKRCRQQRAASLGLASAEEAELDQLIKTDTHPKPPGWRSRKLTPPRRRASRCAASATVKGPLRSTTCSRVAPSTCSITM